VRLCTVRLLVRLFCEQISISFTVYEMIYHYIDCYDILFEEILNHTGQSILAATQK
jgi:hypothetical protein